MIELDLTQAELHVLLETLENDLSDLRMEIADTDSLDFRNMLKGRKAVLSKVIQALQTT